MKKFSKIVETIENGNFYRVEAQIQLIIPAENEGEAGYISDSTLSGIEYTSDYTINNIEKTDERILNEWSKYTNKIATQQFESSKEKIKSELVGNQYQMVSGIIDILRQVKDINNRMEIAYDMIGQFKRENIDFDYNNFINSIK